MMDSDFKKNQTSKSVGRRIEEDADLNSEGQRIVDSATTRQDEDSESEVLENQNNVFRRS